MYAHAYVIDSDRMVEAMMYTISLSIWSLSLSLSLYVDVQYTHTHIYIYAYIYITLYICMCVYVFVCMHISTRVHRFVLLINYYWLYLMYFFEVFLTCRVRVFSFFHVGWSFFLFSPPSPCQVAELEPTSSPASTPPL